LAATLHRGIGRDKRARFPILFVGIVDRAARMRFKAVNLAEYFSQAFDRDNHGDPS